MAGKHIDNTKRFKGDLDKVLKQAMEDIVDDLARTASGATPFDKGILQSSYEKEVKKSGEGYEGVVYFSAKENGYDYAIKMHEGNYKLGAHSIKKGGVTGMSGRSYKVGRKFLTRVLEGEEDAYKNHVNEMVKRVTKNYNG